LDSSLTPKVPVGCRIVYSTLIQLWLPSTFNIWTPNQVSNSIVKPKKDVVFRVSDYGVVWYSWLMELVKPTFQPLMCVVTHWILKWVLGHPVL
jgi:hypothetical protein